MVLCGNHPPSQSDVKDEERQYVSFLLLRHPYPSYLSYAPFLLVTPRYVPTCRWRVEVEPTPRIRVQTCTPVALFQFWHL